MEVFEKVRSFGRSIGDWASAKVVAVAAVAGAMVTSAHAQSTGGGTGGGMGGSSVAFTQAVQQASADIATYGAALVGVAAVGVVFMVAIKYVKKIRGAA